MLVKLKILLLCYPFHFIASEALISNSSIRQERQVPGATNGCDATLNEDEGWIFSPNYPSDYENDRTCRYEIRKYRNDVCLVEITFMDFDVDESSSCYADYLNLQEGLPGGERLCGTIAPGTKRTLTFPPGRDVMTAIFHSDSSRARKGFMVKINQLSNSCNGRVDVNTCDKEIAGFEGRLTSTGFPESYPNEQKCRYQIRKVQSDVCVVEFDFLTFELSNGICTGDFLQLPDGKQLCGFFKGPKLYRFVPGAVNMNLMFVSDSYQTGKGFDILVRQRPNSCENVRPSRDSCDRVIVKETATIHSPGYPGDYFPSAHCVYSIRRVDLRVCRVQLDFVLFDVAESPDCLTDFLEIDSTGERLCGRNVVSGKVVNFPSGSDVIRFTFHSGFSRQSRQGFEIRITQLRDSCFRPLETTTRVCASVTEYSSVIQSDRYPLPYDADTECMYRIVRASRAVCRVELAFNRFDVGTGRDRVCIGDYLEIPGHGRFCGRRDGETVSVDFPDGQNELLLRFRTDSYDQHTGFRIEIRQLIAGCKNERPSNQGCSETFVQETFDIMSPGFQNGSYRPNEDCRYQIRKYSFDVCALELHYNVFDIEESDDCTKDYLEIRDLKICGKLPLDSTRTYEFPEDTLVIRFSTDGYNQRAGFFFSARQKKC